MFSAAFNRGINVLPALMLSKMMCDHFHPLLQLSLKRHVMLTLPINFLFLMQEPGYALLITILSPLATIIIVGPFLHSPTFKWLSGVLAGTAAIVFFPGFALSIILFFSGVSGVKILFCWLALLLGVLSFVLLNHRQLSVVVSEYNRKTDPDLG
ncbi:hypothetical protein ACS91J_19140 [Pectobacterium carotovorum]